MSGLGTAHSGEVGRRLTVGSLFSGIGGFDLGLERAGHRVLWQVEFDKQARSVLRRHWPGVTIYEDVCHVGGLRLDAGRERGDGQAADHERVRGDRPDAQQQDSRSHGNGELGGQRSTLAPVDLVCGGFPCQDLSVAGRRAGLDGERSGLWFEFYRIVSELLPCWVLVENVPGLRSSEGGRDLAVILRGLAGLGYVGAWRSLDSQYFGVAQRRERIFLLACRRPRAGCPAEVLALAEGLSGHPAPSREAGARAAVSFTERTRGEGRSLEFARDIAYALDNPGEGGRSQTRLVAAPITSREQKGPDSDRTSGFVLAHTLRADGFDASEDGTGRGTPIVAAYRKAQKAHDPDDCERWEEAERTNTLNGQGDTAATVALAFHHKASAHQSMNPSELCPALGVTKEPAITGTVPRRLTPRECERLQGFPDDWTRYTDTGRELADGPRYRMLGNAITVNVAEWIGHRLARPHDGAVPSHTRSTSDE